MSSWKFSKESGDEKSGTIVGAGLKSGSQPFADAQVLSSKRNVIATEKGWVRRQIKKDVHGNVRTIDEVLVAANPGSGLSYASNTNLGNPDIAQVFISTPRVTGGQVNVYVVFNEPVRHSGLAGRLKLAVANTAGGNAVNARALASNSNTGIVIANNTLLFQFVAPASAGTYKVNAQTIANGSSLAANLRSLNAGGEVANLVITGAVSNALATFTIPG